MIKKLWLAASLVAMFSIANAQKVLSTKNGEISFYSSTPVEDIQAKNSQAQSVINPATGELKFVVLIKGFVFENSLMQQHFNDEYMESSKFPKAEFKGKILNLAAVNFTKDGKYPAKVEGDLTIRGVTKKVAADGVITVAKQKTNAKAKFKIAIKDFNIAGSEVGKSIAKELEINVNCNYK